MRAKSAWKWKVAGDGVEQGNVVVCQADAEEMREGVRVRQK